MTTDELIFNEYSKIVKEKYPELSASWPIVSGYNIRGGFYRIGAPQIKTLPIAFPKNSSIIDKIENLVEKIIEYKQDNYETSEIEKEIDSLIYEIYDLTDEEVQIIEQN